MFYIIKSRLKAIHSSQAQSPLVEPAHITSDKIKTKSTPLSQALGSIYEETDIFIEKSAAKRKYSSANAGYQSPTKVKKSGVNSLSALGRRKDIYGMSGELYDNLRLATHIAKEIRQAVPYSTNIAHLRSDHVINTPGYEDLNEQLEEVRDTLLICDNWEDYIDITNEECRHKRLGDSQELALMACKSLKDRGIRHVDYVRIKDTSTDNIVIPHMIAVIGREDPVDHSQSTKFEDKFKDNKPDIGRPHKWNETEVVCDPWAGIACLAKDYDKLWTYLKACSDCPESLTCHLVHRLPN